MGSISWEGIVGRSFTPEEFAEYVAGLNWGEWRPEFLVLHNTEDPSLAKLPNGYTHQDILDLEKYYRDECGWHAGPHLVVDDHQIWVFSALTAPGVHANSWNSRTIGVEMLGDYRREPFDSGRGLVVQRNAVAAVAILSKTLNLAPDTLMLHKENGETEHDCPGANVHKGDFIQAVKDYLAGETPAARVDQTDPPQAPDNTPQGGPTMTYRVQASSLNIRSGPGTNYQAIGTISAGETVTRVDISGWIAVLLDDNSIGWLSKQYLHEAPVAGPDQGSGDQEVPATTVESSPEPAPERGPGASGAYDFSTKEGTIAAIKTECDKQGLILPAQIAYVLATVDWETGHTFKPVREAFWKDEEWRRNNLYRYYPYYGRGFVQLTWEDNYRKYSEILGVDLVTNPDLAMDPENALFILVHGFRTGAFTGKKIAAYISSAGFDFINARRCINGLDKAQEIATIAERFLEA